MGDHVARLGLSAARFGPRPTTKNGGGSTERRLPESEAAAATALAVDSGLRLFDAGPRQGDAETMLGRLIGRAPDHRPALTLVTRTLGVEAGLAAVERHARRSHAKLGLGGTDRGVILARGAGDLLGPEGPALWAFLNKLRDEGLFAQIGIRAGAADDPAALARRFKPDVMQVPASLLDQRLVANGALNALAALGVEVHLVSALMGGVLFMPRDGLPLAKAALGPELSRARRALAEAGADPLRAALSFALRLAEVDKVIVGISSCAELRAILAAVGGAPAPDLVWADFAMTRPEHLYATTPASREIAA